MEEDALPVRTTSMTEHMENDKEERKWKVLRSEYLFRRPWLTVRRERIGLPGGGEIPEYYVLEYPDWVNTIARTCTGEFVFVRQYRRGLDRTCFELCAGVRDPQDATPEAAAQIMARCFAAFSASSSALRLSRSAFASAIEKRHPQ